MALELERKFLVRPDWTPAGMGTAYIQAYLAAGGGGPDVRIRVAGDRAFLTVKGPAEGIARREFEYAIPPADAREMLHLARGGIIEKTRYRIEHAGHTWEVDVFQGGNSGLVLAEVELSLPDEQVELPGWVGKEVSLDHRYANAYLAQHPWGQWGREGGGP